MEVQLVKIEREERHVLENLFCYYVYDMSEYMKWNPAEDGTFGGYDVSKFDPYWIRDDHVPYFIKVDNQLAGFVLIRRYPSDFTRYDVAQFFVLRKFKAKVSVSVFWRKSLELFRVNGKFEFFWKTQGH